jgi:hypothetical protein
VQFPRVFTYRLGQLVGHVVAARTGRPCSWMTRLNSH